MGYTHYYAIDPQADEFRDRWEDLRLDVGTIVHAARTIFDVDLDVSAIGSRILLNGVGEDEHEDLLIPGPNDPELGFWIDQTKTIHGCEDGFIWLFCKTARKPYDLVVCAILERAAQLMPNAFIYSSDGRWDVEWAYGAMQWKVDAAGDVWDNSPRGLVRRLFIEDPFGDYSRWEERPIGTRAYFDTGMTSDDVLRYLRAGDTDALLEALPTTFTFPVEVTVAGIAEHESNDVHNQLHGIIHDALRGIFEHTSYDIRGMSVGGDLMSKYPS